MKHMIFYYNSDNERVTIRADDTVIGELRKVKVDNVSFVIKTLQEMCQEVINLKK